MLKIFLGAGILLLCACSTKKHQVKARLSALLNNREYFRLRDYFSESGAELDTADRMYFEAFVDNAFNRNAQSIQIVKTLQSRFPALFNDSEQVALLRLQNDNYFKSGLYAAAAQTDSDLLLHYSAALDSSSLDDIKNELLIRDALYSIPPQQVSITENNTIRWTTDRIGLAEIPVTCKGVEYSCIFDTRANISSITETFAKKLGLRMLNVSYNEGSGLTGIQFKTGLGVADSLYIGSILLQNVVFQVMPDKVLYLAPIRFSLNIILGYPAIAQLKEVHFSKDGIMTVPLHPSSGNLHNMAMDKLNPVVSVESGGDTLCFYFDSGAGSSDFFSSYFRKHKMQIMKEGTRKTVQTGGAGGIINNNVYILDSLRMLISNRQIILKNATIRIDPIPNNNEKFYGNIGHDVIDQFNDMTINFEDMYIEFR